MSASAGPVLEVSGVSKEFFGISVLRDVSFTLAPGGVLGLVGENGAGKSTLVNIIGGVLKHDHGSVHLEGQLHSPTGAIDAARGIAFVSQELNLFSNLSIAENLFLTSYPRVGWTPLLNRKAARAQANTLLRRVGLERSADALVETLSPGERQLVEISKALLGDPKVVIFDEPTTSLTTRESDRLFDLIRELAGRGTAIIYISHILGDVIALADDLLVLRDGSVVASGPVGEFDTSRMINAMVGRTFDSLFPDRHAEPSERRLVEVRELTQRGVVKNVTFSVHEGEVVGVFGLMGSGRTELLRMIFGLDSYESGTVTLAGHPLASLKPRESIRRGMAFVTEDRREEGLLMDFDVTDNVVLASLGSHSRSPLRFVDTRRVREAVTDIQKTLRLRARSMRDQAVRSLSGGNQQKVVLGKWLLTRPQLFLLDEPTRGIDVGAKHEVYGVIDDLANNGAAVLVVSSELDELIGICDRILVMRQGEVTGEFTADAFESGSILRAAFGEHDMALTNPAADQR